MIQKNKKTIPHRFPIYTIPSNLQQLVAIFQYCHFIVFARELSNAAISGFASTFIKSSASTPYDTSIFLLSPLSSFIFADKFAIKIKKMHEKKSGNDFLSLPLKIECSLGESNPQLPLRRGPLYPFN